MSEENFTSQERSETPTPRRRELARQEGRVARSPELSGAVTLMAGVVALAAVGGGSIAAFTAGTLRESAAALAQGPMTQQGAAAALRSLTLRFALALLPFAAAATGAALLAGFVQTRG